MSRVIRIPEGTFEKLQALATPLVDTPGDVVDRIADREIERQGVTLASNGTGEQHDIEIRLDARNPDDLRFTRIRRAQIQGENIRKPNWRKLVRLMHVSALEELGSFEDLLRATRTNIRRGRYEEDGFTYVPNANISIGPQDANDAWQSVLRLAQELEVPVTLELEWRDKDKASHPGERARMSWRPSE